MVRDTITDFDRHDHDQKCSVKNCGDHDGDDDDKGWDHSGTRSDHSGKRSDHSGKRHHEKDHDDCRKDRFEQVCGKAKSMGFFPGGGIPQAQEGLLPGTFIGPTLIFPGVLNPGIPTRIPPTNRTRGVRSTQVQINPGGRF